MADVPLLPPKHHVIINNANMTKICKNCGAQNLEKAKFCSQCGEEFTANIPEPRPIPWTSRLTAGVIIWGILCLISVIACVMAICHGITSYKKLWILGGCVVCYCSIKSYRDYLREEF